MCGLVGVASVRTQQHRDWLQRACDVLIHRGPDSANIWWNNHNSVGLAHRRLAIIDLSQKAAQPMHSHDNQISLIFNGEIYNYRELKEELKDHYPFCSDSDTEVVIAAYQKWGKDFVQKLNGMFAFALYDGARNTLLLGRDRAGEKPLFYAIDNGSITFASELKALLAYPETNRNLDWAAFDCYLAFGFVPDSLCILRGVNKLPAGHTLLFNLNTGESQIHRFWSLPYYEPISGRSQQDMRELVSQLETLVKDAVSRQLIADVPIGILLSGGLDSSLITAFASEIKPDIQTFTVTFPGYSTVDESQHARRIASHFGTNHHELRAEASTADLIPELVRQFDEPVADSSMLPTFLVSKLVKGYCTVALGGDGGDELFAGYEYYRRLRYLERKMKFVPLFGRRAISKIAEKFIPLGFAGSNLRTWIMAYGYDLKKEIPPVNFLLDRHSRKNLTQNIQQYVGQAESVYANLLPDGDDVLQKITRYDFGSYLVDDLLVKIDRASMMNSLEIRAPLLDYRIVEFAYSRVPSEWRASSADKKVLLKQLARKKLPGIIDIDRKQGFSIPLKEWLKNGPFRQLFWDVLTDPECVFNAAAVRSLLDGQDRGRDNSERLFSLVQFELWRKLYRVTF